MVRVSTLLLALYLVGLLGVAFWLALEGRPGLFYGGLALSAAAPLGFLAWSKRIKGPRRHPVMISVFSGFGCVMTMVGVQRFGEQHQWIALLALGALAGWMIYQRWLWRRDPEV